MLPLKPWHPLTQRVSRPAFGDRNNEENDLSLTHLAPEPELLNFAQTDKPLSIDIALVPKRYFGHGWHDEEIYVG